ncbi:hypothetical protein BN946_scf184500.g1, partial [Trametes cinnabarina]
RRFHPRPRVHFHARCRAPGANRLVLDRPPHRARRTQAGLSPSCRKCPPQTRVEGRDRRRGPRLRGRHRGHGRRWTQHLQREHHRRDRRRRRGGPGRQGEHAFPPLLRRVHAALGYAEILSS